MRANEIFENIGDEDDLLEQFKYEGASIVTEIYNIMCIASKNFTLVPDRDLAQHLKKEGMKMFLHREKAIKALGEESNTVRKINIVLDYIQKL